MGTLSEGTPSNGSDDNRPSLSNEQEPGNSLHIVIRVIGQLLLNPHEVKAWRAYVTCPTHRW